MYTTHTITVTGNVDVGKITTLPFVAQALDAEVIQADDLFQTFNPFRDVYLANLEC